MCEKELLGIISFGVNHNIAVDWIGISRSNKVYFSDNYTSVNYFICNIIAEIVNKGSFNRDLWRVRDEQN